MTTPNPYAPPTARVSDVHGEATEASPRLWNPRVAANWSLLFSPVFGAWVQMKNWQALGEPARAQKSKNWVIASVAFFVVMTVLAVLLPDTRAMDGITRVLALVLLVVWYYANGKSQQAYVLGKFGKTYPKKGWGKPLLWAVAGLVGFVVAMGAVGFVIGMLTGAP